MTEMAEPKASLLIATLNEEENIKRLLDSLQQQTFKDFEIVAVDSYSTDQTVNILKSYGAKVLSAPKGIALARNLAAKNASSGILVFTDADTIWPKHNLAKIYKVIAEEGYDAVAGPGAPITENKFLQLEYKIYNIFRLLAYKLPKPMKSFNSSGYNVAIRKKVFDTLGGWPKVSLNDDGMLGAKLLKNAKVKFAWDIKVEVSDRRVKKMGLVGFNLYFLFVLENFLPFLRPVFSKIKSKQAEQFHAVRQ